MENMNMILNQIPSPTWNWLHMNETQVDNVAVGSQGRILSDIPGGVSVKEENKAGLNDKTALGEDMDRLIVSSGCKVLSIRREKEASDSGEPVRLTFNYEADKAAANAVEIYVEEGAELTVIMNFESTRDAAATAAVQTRYHVSKDARLTLVQVEKLGDKFTFLNDIGGEVDELGNFTLTQLVLSGKNTYQGAYNNLTGKKASLQTDIGYMVLSDQVLDMNYVAYHTGKKTKCVMNADGVLRGNAKKVFRGTIDFRRGCAGAKGDELENVLLMDDDVINQTIPVILCDEEDVEGNHGASIGKVDESLMFYLSSRGMDESEIYEMMARARIDAVTAKIADAQTREEIAQYLGDAIEE